MKQSYKNIFPLTFHGLFLLYFVLSSACTVENEMVILPDTFEVLISENNEEGIVLLFQTQVIFNCSNYTIQKQEQKQDGKFEINLGDVEIPRICATSLGPATTRIKLGKLPNGAYALHLNKKEIINMGSMEVTNDKIEMKFDQLNGFVIKNPVLHRN
jgi:hypothetical protein